MLHYRHLEIFLPFTKRNRLFLLFFILCLKLCFSVLLISFGGFGLSPDEAQYWTWSKALDLGYYSKPPAVAWQIALTTSIFGDSALGIRMGALLLSFCLPLAVFRLVRGGGGSSHVAFLAAICTALSPFGIFYSFPATTDLGMILFLTLAMDAVIRGPHYLLVGAYVLVAALYKWTAFALWPFVFLFACFYPHLRKKELGAGIALSLLALIPSVVWNFEHDFATFRHVGRTLFQGGAHGKIGGNFFDFFASQVGLVSPIYFALFIYGSLLVWKKRKERDFFLLFSSAFASLLFLFFFLSLFKKMQPNWPFFLYPSLMIGAACAASQHRKGIKWLYGGTWLSIAFSIITLSIPYLQSHGRPIPYAFNPFQQILGWDKLPPALKEVGFKPKEDFLFGDKYQISSLLSFYNEEKQRAYFFNLSQQRKNQFAYWPAPAAGKTGYFVIAANGDFDKVKEWYITHYLDSLSPYFSKVEMALALPLFEAGNKTVKFAFIFRCQGYNGQLPPLIEKY